MGQPVNVSSATDTVDWNFKYRQESSSRAWSFIKSCYKTDITKELKQVNLPITKPSLPTSSSSGRTSFCSKEHLILIPSLLLRFYLLWFLFRGSTFLYSPLSHDLSSLLSSLDEGRKERNKITQQEEGQRKQSNNKDSSGKEDERKKNNSKGKHLLLLSRHWTREIQRKVKKRKERMARTRYLVVVHVVTAGLHGDDLGSDEEDIVLFSWLVVDISNCRVCCLVLYARFSLNSCLPHPPSLFYTYLVVSHRLVKRSRQT